MRKEDLVASTVTSGDLVVSSKVLGHISEGLYRGPAGVLKELISNAFDANARTVWISTGWPTFNVVSVQDDGDGMTLRKFRELVDGGIGDSDKRASNPQLINQRPVIGRLGIGLLGVSQISHEFSIVSHSREAQQAFRAKVEMRDFRREILDQTEIATPQESRDNSSESGGFPVGGYEVEEIPFVPQKTGLMITASDPTEGFRRQLSEGNPGPLPKRFDDFCEASRTRYELATGPLYNRMLWQVASLVPISYMSRSTVSQGDASIIEIANTLNEFGFSVIVDGVKLFKPILLDGPTTEVHSSKTVRGEGPFHFPLGLDEIVWDSPLRVRGYIYGSAGKLLQPDDIRGVLIRLKHVGIGEYDKSFLGYRFAEGPRFAWLTGELFVEQGLEDALTVGRDGFDAGHPHYIALRRWLHRELRNRVFPTLYRGIRSRRQNNEAKRSEARAIAFQSAIARFAGKPVEIREVAERDSPPVQVDLSRGVATLNTRAGWPRGSRQREMAQRLSIIFEVARTAESDLDAVEGFVELTKKLLSQK